MRSMLNMRIFILSTIVVFASVLNANALQISVTSWAETTLVGEAELRLLKENISEACDIYGALFHGSRPIRLEVKFQDLGNQTCARAGSVYSAKIPGLPGIYYPYTLAAQLIDHDILEVPACHAQMIINTRFVNDHRFDYSLTPDVPIGKVDFLNTVLHELGHCMGFHNLCNGDGSWFVQPSEPRVSDLDSWFLAFEDFLGDYVPFVSLAQYERSVALTTPHSLYWWGSNVASW